MRIAYVLDSWPRLSETFVVREIAYVAARHDVRILALEAGDEKPTSPEAEALSSLVTHLAPTRGIGAWLRALGGAVTRPRRDGGAILAAIRGRSESTLRRLPALRVVAGSWRAWGVERIHAHFAKWSTAAAEVLAAATGAPFGFTAHAYDVFVSPTRLAEKVRRAAWAIACTEAARLAIEQRGGRSVAERVRVVRHGVNLAEYCPRDEGVPRTPGPLRVLAVGRLVEKKGFDRLVEAIGMLKGRGVEVDARIVGEGPEEEALRRRAHRLQVGGAAGPVSMVGVGPPSLVRDIMRTWADVLVAPSRVAADGDRDGIPNVVGEALACGVPVVATAVGGLPEIVVDGLAGLVVPDGNEAGTKAIAAALERLAGDADLRARLSAGARATACERFDASKNLAEFLRVLEAGSIRG